MAKLKRWRRAPTGIDWNYGDLDIGGSISQSGRSFHVQVWYDDGEHDTTGEWNWDVLKLAQGEAVRWIKRQERRAKGSRP